MNALWNEICNNEEMICDVLLDYCYKYNGNKEILWNVSGEVIVKRLSIGRSLYYPVIDADGDFEVQGKRYYMREYVLGGEVDEI
jgi:hypothetical protein